jgi:hypothetical protein
MRVKVDDESSSEERYSRTLDLQRERGGVQPVSNVVLDSSGSPRDEINSHSKSTSVLNPPETARAVRPKRSQHLVRISRHHN